MKIINSLRSGKAARLDKIPNDLLKDLICLRANAFNNVFSGRVNFHNSIKTAKIVLIQKKTTLVAINNWRPISLESTIYKTYSKVVAK